MRRGVLSAVTVTRNSSGTRLMTTRGQFNPFHAFAFRLPSVTGDAVDQSRIDPQLEAKDAKQFKALITNPGPLRVTYSPDYLDWYYRAYNEKLSFTRLKAAGSIPPPTGRHHLPTTSSRRQLGDRLKTVGHRMVEEGSVQHGYFDCFERQPQFPNIHIDRCEDRHVRAILNEIFFDETLDGDALWEKALMYRAIILANRKSYPEAFDYILPFAEGAHFADDSPAASPDASTEEAKPASDPAKYLTKQHGAYFTWLVRRYHVANAVEAHVVLRCHRRSDVNRVLFSNPPPAEDSPDFAVPSLPQQYPNLQAFLLDENLALARCLIFGEFNTFVSADPFVKYPDAHSAVTMPYGMVAQHIQGTDGKWASRTIATQHRDACFLSMAQTLEESINARSRDVMRQQNVNAASDGYFNKELAALSEENPGGYQSDTLYYNPRTVRAELRDSCSRKVLRGIKHYQLGRQLGSRPAMSEIALQGQQYDGGKAFSAPLPSLPHFLRLLTADVHVSFATTLATHDGSILRQRVRDAAAQLYRCSLVFHKPYERSVERQKVVLAFTMLDKEVERVLRQLGAETDPETGAPTPVQKAASRLGLPLPFATRPIEQFGFPTDARYDDYRRWMAKPVGLKAPAASTATE